ncbi:uncharacterized protein LOC129757763 [Uranotaenia lowii]|uniref:uncharacterized protein LOC129757763 n=1 Tax=Uranotaenia lowii TaxID=190385 RepID=UPI00247AE863|nr:uncharacterized protein LOC129757763 [Uranotaenia lowii]XP_055611035.1 uncharacterized protein LOC129757763 [Uranotaenia lowii]
MMYSSSSRTLPAPGEKRPTERQQSFIQRFYLFGTSPNSESSGGSRSTTSSAEAATEGPQSPGPKKFKKSKSLNDTEDDPQQNYSVQRLKQFWNNRLSLSVGKGETGGTVDGITRKLKSQTLGSGSQLRKPPTPEVFRRNGSTRGSASRRNIVRNSLVPLYTNLGSKKVGSPKVTRAKKELGPGGVGDDKVDSTSQKRTSVVLSPVRDQKKDKRSCLGGVGYNAGFPLVTATPTGGRISWAKRIELLGLRPSSDSGQSPPAKQVKMPMREENFVSNFIEVDIQDCPPSLPTTPIPSEENEVPPPVVVIVPDQVPAQTVDSSLESSPTKLGHRDSLESKKSNGSSESHSLGRRHGTPTRKVSFRTTTTPFNRKLFHPSGNKVAALTNKFNKLIQQDAAILEEVRKRGGYLHKSGGHVYKVIDGDGNGSLRKKPPLSAAPSVRTDESSDDISIGSKGSYRKPSVKKRPSLRKNLYRKPDQTDRTSLCVSEALEIFEPNAEHLKTLKAKAERKPPAGRIKPKVPDKSDHVLQKTKELKSKNNKKEGCDSCSNEVQEAVPNSYNESVVLSPTTENTQPDHGDVERIDSVEIVEPLVPVEAQSEHHNYSVVVKKSSEMVEEAVRTPVEQSVEVKPKKDKKGKALTKAENIYDKIEEIKVKPKSTVQKIYEKFTFRSTKKINLSSSESQLNSPAPEVEDRLIFVPDNHRLTRKSFITSIEIPTIHMEEPTESSSDPADRKIVDAIRSVDKKIDNLSRSFNDLTLNDPPEEVPEKFVEPNNSFLYRSMSRIGGPEASVSQMNIVQAINTVVINKSISMDDHHFPCRGNLNRLSLNEKIPIVVVETPPSSQPVENEYEIVSRVDSPKLLQENSPSPKGGSTMSIDIAELTSKIESFVYKTKHSENLYQSIDPSGKTLQQPIDHDRVSVNSYESFENYESIDKPNANGSSPKEEDTYEVCLPPRNESRLPPTPSPINDPLPLPQPKRNLSSSPHLQPKIYQSTYEKIHYDKSPPRPPKPEDEAVPLPPRNQIPPLEQTTPPSSQSPNPSLNLEDNDSEPIYEENIYDTIKSSGGMMDYDEPNGSDELAPGALKRQPPATDTVSLVSSGCYESIGSKLALDFLRIHGAGVGAMMMLPRMGSITTLDSDQITNSLYGCSTDVVSMTPPSERESDTSNSAEWTDISDDEDEETGEMRTGNFIIVRKRNKAHQTPVWSRKVRHKMMNQQQQPGSGSGGHSPKADDDSDHVYESLEAHGQSRLSSLSTGSTPTNLNRRILPALPSNGLTSPSISDGHPDHNHRMATDDGNFLVNDDDFDSFDSDNESDEDHHRKNDSGVDISNAKLPDPPPSSGQVYAIMQKIKSLGTLSKSEIAKGLHKFSKKRTSSSKSPKIFTGEGLTQLSGTIGTPEADHQTINYENTPLPKVPKTKSKSFKLPLQLGSKPPTSDEYENTEFHSPIAVTTPTSPSPSPNSSALASSPASEQADKSLLASISNSDSSNVSTFRKKSKTGKSLRSKLRKSLQSESSLNLGSSFNGSRSTFYVTDSLDVDSGIFNGNEPNSSSSNLNVASVGPDQKDCPSPQPKTTPDADRRKSAGGITCPASRPTNPPPPPPPANGSTPAGSGDKKFLKNRKLGATSWYAECGVFKSETLHQQACFENELKNHKERGGNTSWYAEVGLYQTSGASVASSSESSGVSTGGEGGPGDDHSHSMFVNEPLYQIYNAAKLESLTRDIDAEIEGSDPALFDDDGYEKISDGRGKPDGDGFAILDDDGCLGRKLRPTAFELIEPNVGKLRTLWCEVPEVINSEILLTLTANEKRLQEAKFEILTSEASYLKSLNLLRSHFINHPAFRDVKVLTSSERKTLFANIIPVQECSDRLLCDLENCWQDNIMLLGLSQSIFKHAEKHFHVYVNYCENQAKIDRKLKYLKANKAEFAKTLIELESDPICCGLSLSSFLMLPMQRITRMRLLLDAVLQRLKCDDDEFESWEKTFVLINRILKQCNDAAHRSEQMFEMEMISRQIEFPTSITPLAIAPCGIGFPGSVMRKLEKRGELLHILWRGDDAKLTFGKKFSKSNIYAFLFTDLLVLTKKKGDETYLVTDYCQRALLTVTSGDVVPQLPTKEMQALGKHLIILTLLENHEGKTVEMIVSCPSETERERWLKVTEPLASENPDEKIYEQWDCPQVIAVHPYHALQPDELDLDIKDVVNVHRKMADGWYEGERIRDGVTGWFPSNYTKEIFSSHIRAKHIKQRYMLLSYTSRIIDTTTLQHVKKK